MARAPRMTADDRRESLIDAAIPLLIEHGADLTTKQVATAAGVAEGTLFRVFPDKASLMTAIIQRAMDPAPTLERLRGINAGQSLEAVIRETVSVLQERIERMMTVMHAVGPHAPSDRYAGHHPQGKAKGAHMIAETDAVITVLLEPHAHELRLDPKAAVAFIRIIAFGAALPQFAAPDLLTTDAIVDLILRGIVKEGH